MTALAAAISLAGGLARADDAMSSSMAMGSGSMMRSDGTMMMSPAMMKMAHDAMAANSCHGMMSMMKHSMMPGSTAHCFKVRIDNISSADQFTASNGTKWSLPFSPGVFVVTGKSNPVFTVGARDRGQGLRAQAEDGDPTSLAAYVQKAYPGSGAFLVPVGGSKPKGILPGESFEFYVVADPSQKFYFVTMNGQSNDWYYSTPSGVALFDATGKPTGGDITSQVRLYDAGTEADQEIGIGSTQGPRQPHPRYGPDDSNALVRLATSDARLIDVTQVMRVTVTPQ
jgi:hypothetical protein